MYDHDDQAYDDNRNTLTKVDTRTSSEPVNFQYDARDRLVQVTQNQLGVETFLGQFDYNHEGDRRRFCRSEYALVMAITATVTEDKI